MSNQPKTGKPCTCKRGVQRDNCPQCEGTGMQIDFQAIRAKRCSDCGHPLPRFDCPHSGCNGVALHTNDPRNR